MWRQKDAAASGGVCITIMPSVLDPAAHSPALVQQQGCGHLRWSICQVRSTREYYAPQDYRFSSDALIGFRGLRLHHCSKSATGFYTYQNMSQTHTFICVRE